MAKFPFVLWLVIHEGECNMDIKECYDAMGADYNDILARLRNTALITKLVKKFEADENYKILEESLQKKDVDSAFRAAHTLKGVCLNLGFSQLTKDTVALTEILRSGSLDGTQELFDRIKPVYEKTVKTIRELD